MSRIWRWLAGGVLFASVAVGAACAVRDEAASSSSAPLIKWSGTALWDGGVVTPICFVNGSPQQWDWARTAVEESWGNAANVRFVGWKACKMNDPTPQLTVGIGTANQICGNAKVSGSNNLRPPNQADDAGNLDPSVWVCFGDPDGGNVGRATFEGTFAHEFGHVLGFEHEQDSDGGFTDPGFGTPGGDAGYCSPTYLTDDAGNPVHNDAGDIAYNYGSFPDQVLTPYDPDSIMNYCHQDREDQTSAGRSGRISDSDIQGVQSVYGMSTRTNANGDLDSDGDGWADYRDNCPYTKNDQTDSNFDAELTLARQDPNWSTDDGHRPLVTDTQAYKAHWHDKYKGDACDPIASTSVAAAAYTSILHTGCCTIRYVGGVTASTTDCNQQCPYTFNTGLSWASYIGGPAGFSQARYTNSAPAFCACDQMFGANQSRCTDPNDIYKCVYADDTKFPPLNGNPGTGKWNAITTEVNAGIYRYDAIHSSKYMKHVNLEPWLAPPTYASNWDLIADLPAYGKLLPPTHDDLLGLMWAHVNSTYPDTIVNRPDPTNLQNSYTPMDSTWRYGEIIHWVPPFGRRWWRIPYCNPLNALQHVKYGQISYGVSGDNSGDDYVVAQDENGIYEFTSALTDNAFRLMYYVSTDIAEILVADDRVGGWPTDAINPNAIVVRSGTTTLMGAFTTSGTKMDAQLKGIPNQSTTTLRSYVASTGKLYSLEYAGGWQLNARDVPTMLTGVASNVVHNVTGAIPTSPQAVVWNSATSRLIVIDWLTTSERLLAIDSNGVSTELWRTRNFSGPQPSLALSATNVGEIVLSQWGLADGNTHVLVMWSDGRPESSTTIAGSVQSAVVANSSGLTAPITQPVGETRPNVAVAYVDRSALAVGVCGSGWFNEMANNGAGSGSLADGMVCPGSIMNGGFESGTFLNWTATGQSETISTNAHSGAYSAMLGATTPTTGDSTVQQAFVVPATGGTLSFWYSSVCPDTVYYDWFTATLLDAGGQLLATIVPNTCATSSAWTQATLNLAPWAGQTVSLVLTSHDDGYPGDPTYSFVDDVGVQ